MCHAFSSLFISKAGLHILKSATLTVWDTYVGRTSRNFSARKRLADDFDTKKKRHSFGP